jgi:PAS domain S-box-containing protein
LDAQLRVHEQRMRLLVDGMRDYAIISLDADGLVGSWNAGAEKLFGWTADEVRGRPLEPLELDAGASGEAADATEDGHGGQEGWWPRKDGSRARVSRSWRGIWW